MAMLNNQMVTLTAAPVPSTCFFAAPRESRVSSDCDGVDQNPGVETATDGTTRT